MNARNLPIIVSLCVIGYPLDALAYLDAGTGSMIIQSLIGAIVAGIYFIKMYWHRLLTFFGIRKKQGDEIELLNNGKIKD